MAHHGHVPDAPAGHRDEAAAGKIATVILHLGGLGWASEKAVVERVLSHSPGVRAVEANPASQTATVAFDTTQTSVAELRRWVEECGYHCAGQSVPTYLCDPKEEPHPVDGNGPTADAEEAGAALAVTPAREGYPLSPASATVVPRPRPGRCPPSIAGTRWQPEGRAVCAGDDGPRRRGWHVHGFDGPRHAQPVPGSRHLLGAHLVVVTDRPQRAGFTVAAPFGLHDDVWLLLLSLPVIFYSSWIFFDGAVAALLATGVSLAVAAAVASIAQWGPTSSPACCSRSPTR